MISNAYMLFIIYARVELTQLCIVCLSCLLNVEEAIYQFTLKLESSTGIYIDLHQPSRIRYELKSFSVSCLVSLAYRKGLISRVKLSVVVPQAIGISLRNNEPTFLH